MEERNPVEVSSLERKRIKAFLYYSRLTDAGFGKLLGVPEYEIRRLKGTLKDDKDKPNKYTLEKALAFENTYVQNPKFREHIGPRYYRKGIKYLEGRNNKHRHLRESLRFLLEFHPRQTREIEEIKKSLNLRPYIPKPRTDELEKQVRQPTKKTQLLNALLDKLSSQKRRDLPSAESFYLALCHASKDIYLSDKLNKNSLMIIKEMASYLSEFSAKETLDEIEGGNEDLLLFLSDMLFILKEYHPDSNYLSTMSRFMRECAEGAKNGNIPYKIEISNFLMTFTRDLRYTILLERYVPDKRKRQIEELEKKKAGQDGKHDEKTLDTIADDDSSLTDEEDIAYMAEMYPGLFNLIQVAIQEQDSQQDSSFARQRQLLITQRLVNPRRG